LGQLGLDTATEQEIVAELAGFLEDRHEALLGAGCAEPEARIQCLAEAGDWIRLSLRISRAVRGEETMKDRILQLWLPGSVVSILAFLCALYIDRAFGDPVIILLGPGTFLFFSLPWLLVMILLGAVSTFWSRHAGAERWVRWVVALFPVAALTLLFLFTLLASMIVDPHVHILLKVQFFGAMLFSWVAVPGVALLLGALPFLRKGNGNPAQTILAFV
jgi:hypothetical protein